MEQANLARLKNCMRRGMRGEQLKIGFFGGSITQGSSASSAEETLQTVNDACEKITDDLIQAVENKQNIIIV